MRLTLVHNPTAGTGEHDGEDLARLLQDEGHDVDLVSTKKKKRLEAALQDPGEVVVAAGGDGTVKRCAIRLAGTRTPLAILPLGKGNNVARSLGLIDDAAILARRLGSLRRVARDLGVARVGDEEIRFVEGVGGGLLAEQIARADEELSRRSATLPGLEIDRALVLLREIARETKPSAWRLEVDGRRMSGRWLLVVATLSRMIGPNLPVAPEATARDGRLRLVLAGARDRAALLRHVEARLRGESAPLDLRVLACRRLRITGRGPFHVDDRIVIRRGERVDCELVVDRGALTLLAPPRRR